VSLDVTVLDDVLGHLVPVRAQQLALLVEDGVLPATVDVAVVDQQDAHVDSIGRERSSKRCDESRDGRRHRPAPGGRRDSGFSPAIGTAT
jgi:hypothetical protein